MCFYPVRQSAPKREDVSIFPHLAKSPPPHLKRRKRYSQQLGKNEEKEKEKRRLEVVRSKDQKIKFLMAEKKGR